jgi:uncharacterized protein YndB with AHSA1/START domain
VDQTIAPASVRKELVVRADAATAFHAFAHRMHEWSPASHSLTGRRTNIIIEPRVGGRWYETGEGGTEANWGRVLAWEPSRRMVLAWQLDANFNFDPELITEVEVRFEAIATGGTRVDFEHRNIDRFGAAAPDVFASLDGEDGWSGSLQDLADLLGNEDGR